MVKLIAVFGILLLAAICSAEVPRSNRRLRTRSRFLARQEIAEDVPAQTPYPPAGDKPDVAFDLPDDESPIFEDQAVIGAPDQTYGPPDQTYGPPETEVIPEQAQEDFDVTPELQRFTSIRGNGRLVQQGRRKKAAPLKKAAAKLQLVQPQQPQLLSQPILLADGRIVYSVLV